MSYIHNGMFSMKLTFQFTVHLFASECLAFRLCNF